MRASSQDLARESSSSLGVQLRSLWGVYDGLLLQGWCDRQVDNPHIEGAVIDTSSSIGAMLGYSSDGHSQGYGDVSFGLMKLEKSPMLIIIPIIDMIRREAKTKERLVE